MDGNQDPSRPSDGHSPHINGRSITHECSVSELVNGTHTHDWIWRDVAKMQSQLGVILGPK